MRAVAWALHRMCDGLLWAFALRPGTWRRALLAWGLVAVGGWLVAAAYAYGVFVFAVAGITVGAFGGLMLFVLWGKRTTSTPEWYCPNCKAFVAEPAFTFDPADLDAYCPACNVTLKAREVRR